jgi:hypothetical protein
MQTIEELTDAEIAEAHRSAKAFAEVKEMTAPLDAVLSVVHALDWLDVRDRDGKTALNAFFGGQFGDPIDIALGRADIPTERREGKCCARLLEQVRRLVSEERFLNWQVAFPGVWSNWHSASLHDGFDAVIGNPPWDRMKLQQVEWFAARRRKIAMAQRAADRKRMIADLEKAGDPLARDFARANERKAAATRMARRSSDYPLLSGGDVNLYSLFVERAMTLVKPSGMVGLLTPSGIASDKTAARFFQGVAIEGRLKALYDIENKGKDRPLYFLDVHPQFKFCAFVASPTPIEGSADCAFFLQGVTELDDPERRFPLTPEDFARVNPNTGTAPIFRTRRDAQLTTAIYDRLPVLVDRSSGEEVKAWPVKYSTMFHMTNDSGLFRTREELEEKEGAWPIGGNRYNSPSGEWVPLYEGKMIWHFDHRAASIVINPNNQHRPAYPIATTDEEHQDTNFVPTPQFWVLATDRSRLDAPVLAFRDVTNPTDHRTFDACFIPYQYAGNTLPLLLEEDGSHSAIPLLCGNLNAIVLDYVSRQKVQKNHLSWYIVEQLPVVPPDRYEAIRVGPKTAGDIVRDAVIELTYTASDMAPFARDMGYVDESGAIRPPYPWDEGRRLHLRAKLDAVFFHLYGVTERDDVRYVFSTFPIVERQETEAYGCYRSRDLCLAYINALAAGDSDPEIKLSG